ncbi:MAG TPA: CPBP family intramembrane glutamic endopeptidase [Candidatus Polarisedimenticolaceae bacterium]|nr:CPBP family intramembrane glutamic endopeptidase [Candidatus Polarisedimenticolaceae bacterium]
MNLFWNREERRLRALWRVLGQLLLVFLLGYLPFHLLRPPRGLPAWVAAEVATPLRTLGVIAAVILGRQWLDRRDWEAYGVRLDARGWRALWAGLALGAALLSAIFVLELAFAWVDVTGLRVTRLPVPFAAALALALFQDVCVGIQEELITRGSLLRNLSDGLGTARAVLVSSTLFALLHLGNPNASALGMVGIFAAGVLLAVARLRTGRLQAAIGLHIAWNFFEGAVFGFAVSGTRERVHVIAIAQGGPTLWTGGVFGPEAGLLGIGACLAGIALLFLLPRYPEPTGGTDAEADLPRARLLGDDRGSAPDPHRSLSDRQSQG